MENESNKYVRTRSKKVLAHNTDMAMERLHSKITSNQRGPKKEHIVRKEIERKLAEMLSLNTQEQKGERGILYLRVSTMAQATWDIESWNVVDSTIEPVIETQVIDEKTLENQMKREQGLSIREQRAVEEREEHDNTMKGSLRQQAKISYKHAKEQGIYVVAVIVDIHTGYELHQREGMTEVREMMKDGRISVVCGLCLDRISRNLLNTMVLISEFRDYGVRLDCVQEKIDTSRLGIIMLAIQGNGPEEEREKIRERTMRGRLDKIERGELVGNGYAGYGYVWVKNRKGKNVARAFDEETYDIVRSIGENCMAGMSIRAIKRDLEERGFPPPRGSKRWYESTIVRILRGPKYRGIVQAGAFKRVYKEGRYTTIRTPEDAYVYPEGEEITPAYFSQEEAAKIDATIARNTRDQPRNNSNPVEFLLRTKFVKCGYCGGTMFAIHKSRKENIYICSGKHDGRDCQGVSIDSEKLDREIWAKVLPLIQNTAIMAELFKQLEQVDISEKAVDDFEKTIASTQKSLDRLTRSRANMDEDEDAEAVASIERLMKEQSKIIKQAKEEQAQILPEVQKIERRRASIKKFKEWAEKMSNLSEESNLQEKRDALEALGVVVYVFRRGGGMGRCEQWRMETSMRDFEFHLSA